MRGNRGSVPEPVQKWSCVELVRSTYNPVAFGGTPP